MGIEQRMEFDFSRAEKLEAAHHYNIIASEENLAKLQKKESGEWEFDGISAEKLLEMYSGNDNSDSYPTN